MRHKLPNEKHAALRGSAWSDPIWDSIDFRPGAPAPQPKAKDTTVIDVQARDIVNTAPAVSTNLPAVKQGGVPATRTDIGDGWGNAQTVNDPRSGHAFKNEIHAMDGEWESVGPASTDQQSNSAALKQQPATTTQQNIGDGWGNAQTVNDPRSGHAFKNEIHAGLDGEWKSEGSAGQQPSSGTLKFMGATKQQQQATAPQQDIGDGWGKAHTVNDPRSGFAFKNEIHG